jgi:hypothetical protein
MHRVHSARADLIALTRGGVRVMPGKEAALDCTAVLIGTMEALVRIQGLANAAQ